MAAPVWWDVKSQLNKIETRVETIAGFPDARVHVGAYSVASSDVLRNGDTWALITQDGEVTGTGIPFRITIRQFIEDATDGAEHTAMQALWDTAKSVVEKILYAPDVSQTIPIFDNEIAVSPPEPDDIQSDRSNQGGGVWRIEVRGVIRGAPSPGS